MELLELVVHALDLQGVKPKFNDNILKLQDYANKQDWDKIKDFFEKHINNSRMSSATKNSQFLNLEYNDVLTNIRKVFSIDENRHIIINDKQFLKETKWLTNNIRKCMTKTASKSDGSVFFVIFREGNEYSLAIIKMDPDNGFQINDDLTVTVRENILPSIREKLHKIAIVKLLENYEENESHLFVLDRQVGKNKEAKFFMKDFLDANELANDVNLTRYFQNNLYKISMKHIEGSKLPKLKAVINKRLSSNKEFNLDTDYIPLVRNQLSETLDDVENTLANEIRDFKVETLKRYPDATFTFNPKKDEILPSKYRTENKDIELNVASCYLEGEDYSIEVHEEVTVITLRNGIGKTLRNVN